MPKYSVLINEVPHDVRSVILKEQADHQIKCRCKFSQVKTILKIIRNWGKIRNYVINGVPVWKMVEEM
ncbi:MAG TPA: hypothetical protein PJ995_21440 [Cyclobacteriaceae bacterium]|nr:hypothetical protein [Cyclobacteriaceae bacterium]HNA14616.1 hypothetical protein [Cyclobacteriaceae bacterium]